MTSSASPSSSANQHLRQLFFLISSVTRLSHSDL
ncbi:uncharacterized protein CELE_T19C4.24 [Caenorhabditis elegans]|uniref:Uncharacterized protein n=1 Tax=Caenorhabditis elegans TaxID=6239 RepID=I2HAL1_CAEEL|nr:Uncharacterized protein CELE_T19C4.24 [Caenorhabditis elegans]CCH63940.1 Uncharacterized protein CELE_T19C4.24 [Caenorhabditis elegans]|eukprot:NP_001263862.1 Uncharacterized protein CELE_T19C4.24 [Caenorhabditis elegans]